MKKYKNILTFIAAFLIWEIVIYLGCAAVALSFNASEWSFWTRLAFVAATIAIFYGSLVVYVEYEKKSRE